jgi:hypothetical protein
MNQKSQSLASSVFPMSRIRVLVVAFAGLALGGQCLLAQNPMATPVQNLTGQYERIGVVDPAVEVQFKGLGLVLVPPVSIDELLACPQRSIQGDSEFVFRNQGRIGYVIVLPNVGTTCALSELGVLVETDVGALVLRRPVTLTGEGSSPIHGDREDRFTKERRDGIEWLVIETRIEWTKRSLFRSKRVEYRSLVRFREIAERP